MTIFVKKLGLDKCLARGGSSGWIISCCECFYNSYIDLTLHYLRNGLIKIFIYPHYKWSLSCVYLIGTFKLKRTFNLTGILTRLISNIFHNSNLKKVIIYWVRSENESYNLQSNWHAIPNKAGETSVRKSSAVRASGTCHDLLQGTCLLGSQFSTGSKDTYGLKWILI